LFEEGIFESIDNLEALISSPFTIQDYRGYPIYLRPYYLKGFCLSDEILRMKNVRFLFQNQSKPIHKLISPEPHFVEEERNMIENHFSYLGSSYKSDDIEDWRCFEMDCEGHLVSIISQNFQFSNESIEHLSNFPHLRNVYTSFRPQEDDGIDFCLLSNLRKLEITFENEFEDPELLKDIGLFTNLLSLSLSQPTAGNLTHLNHNFVILFRCDYISSRFFQLIQFGLSFFDKCHFLRFEFSFHFSQSFFIFEK